MNSLGYPSYQNNILKGVHTRFQSSSSREENLGGGTIPTEVSRMRIYNENFLREVFIGILIKARTRVSFVRFFFLTLICIHLYEISFIFIMNNTSRGKKCLHI